MEIPEEILRLVHRYLSGTATDDEKSALVEWLSASAKKSVNELSTHTSPMTVWTSLGSKWI